MALVVKDRVKQFSTTSGTGTLALGATPSGFQAFSVVGDGNTTYYAIVDPSTGDWEVGLGTYTLSGTTLSRDTVLESSNGGSLVNFSVDTKDVFCTYPAETAVFDTPAGVINKSEFPSGTKMMFVQTSAPTGWTKDTTHDNKALRVVSGTAGSGGSAAFTTAFGTPAVSGSVSLSGTVGAHTLTTSEIPGHTHTGTTASAGSHTHPFRFLMRDSAFDWTVPLRARASGANQNSTTFTTDSAGDHTHTFTTASSGGGGSHTHSFSGSGSLSSATASIDVAYVDVIIATKD